MSSSTSSKQMEIKVKRFNWKKKMFITGYYQFEIVIRNNSSLSQERTIHRRFSEIEWLHEGLLKHNPGCLIPNLLEKNIWCNLSVNNSLELEKRKQKIEVYLNYIINHKYLSSNPCFLKFISDNYSSEMIKEDKSSTSSSGLFNALYGISNYIPYLNTINKSKTKQVKYIEDNSSVLLIEKENFMRLKVGLESLMENLREHISINEEKVKSLNAFLSTVKELNYISLDYKAFTNNSNDDDPIEEAQLKQDKKLNNDIEMINSLYERNKKYHNVLESSIIDQIAKYKIKLEGLIEIFERKKVQEAIYQKLQKSEGVSNLKENGLAFQKELINNLIDQFNDEIDNFKANDENDIVNIIHKFFKDKLETNTDIAEIYSLSK